ncbi:MAG: hypothetical protein R6W78_14870 [Bacteroidales bacterium]
MEISIKYRIKKLSIMDKHELAIRTKKAMDEISTKLTDLKNKLPQIKNQEIEEGAKAALDKLEDLNQEIQKKYLEIVEVRDKSNSQMSEMEKNIYNSIESFNNAFTKAGSLFNTH